MSRGWMATVETRIAQLERLRGQELTEQQVDALVAELREDVDALSKIVLEMREDLRKLRLSQQLSKPGKKVQG